MCQKEELSRALAQASAEKSRAEALRVQLRDLDAQIEALTVREAELARQRRKEQADVDALESNGLAALVYAAIGRREEKLDKEKVVIVCGDLNVAHQEIDLKNPKSNRGNAGFSDEERESFTKTLEVGFTDSFRYLYPDAKDCYTWWSYMFKAREKNAGWRIDYFLVSNRIADKITATPIYKDTLGSDHCPVGLEIAL